MRCAYGLVPTAYALPPSSMHDTHILKLNHTQSSLELYGWAVLPTVWLNVTSPMSPAVAPSWVAMCKF